MQMLRPGNNHKVCGYVEQLGAPAELPRKGTQGGLTRNPINVLECGSPGGRITISVEHHAMEIYMYTLLNVYEMTL